MTTTARPHTPHIPWTAQPTHRGPNGPVRARRWSGQPADGIRQFLNGPTNVAYWFGPEVADWHHGCCLFLDLEDGTVQACYPGDWVIWVAGDCCVIAAHVFDDLYRPL